MERLVKLAVTGDRITISPTITYYLIIFPIMTIIAITANKNKNPQIEFFRE